MNGIEANPQSHQPAAPEAAKTVATGTVTERELELERKNKKLEQVVNKTAAAKRKLEVDNAHLADENHRLKQIPAPQQPPAKPASKETSWGFFARS